MTPDRFEQITSRYRAMRVAIVGDFCLDRYLEIDPARAEISIETGLAVHNVIQVRSQPGAAGTILNNLAALGLLAIHPIGFCGTDGEGFELQRALRARGAAVCLDHFFVTADRHTFTYCKPLIVEEGKPPRELNRLDTKNWTPTPSSLEEKLVAAVDALAPRMDAVIVMDQVDVPETGVVTPGVLAAIRALAAQRPELRIVADSRRSLAEFPPVTFKMNGLELAALSKQTQPLRREEAGAAALRLAQTRQCDVFVTLAEEGILGASLRGAIELRPSLALRGPIDIVGAGDAVTANLTLALAAGASIAEALELANAAASVVIHQLGTTGTANLDQIRSLLDVGAS